MRVLLATILLLAVQGSELNSEEIKVWDAVGTFGHNVLSQVYNNSENVLISPLSIHTALAMTSLGAGGETKEEMVSALGFSKITDADLKAGFVELKNRLFQHSLNESTHNQFHLNMANRLYLTEDYPAKKLYVDAVKQTFGADAINTDFKNSAAVKKEINEYVEENTRGLIKKALEDELSSDTVMALVNTLYFKGNWSTRFDKLTGHKEIFNSNCGPLSNPNAKWMQKTRSYSYLDSQELDAKLVEIPYRSTSTRSASMLVILPNEGYGCKTEEWFRKLSWQKISGEMKSMKSANLALRMPIFEIDGAYQLEKVLPTVGMRRAFSAGAEFSNMLQETKGNLKIDKVIHKTKMIVDNLGTEAAAATVATIAAYSRTVTRNLIPVHVTRSFYVALLYRSTNGPALPMFTGVVHKV